MFYMVKIKYKNQKYIYKLFSTNKTLVLFRALRRLEKELNLRRWTINSTDGLVKYRVIEVKRRKKGYYNEL
jgi:hypothetical protein